MKLNYLLLLLLSSTMFVAKPMDVKEYGNEIQAIPQNGIGCHYYLTKKSDNEFVGYFQEIKNNACISAFSRLKPLDQARAKTLWYFFKKINVEEK